MVVVVESVEVVESDDDGVEIEEEEEVEVYRSS